MGWRKDAITEGEIDALYKTACAACNEDTRYPAWRGSTRMAGGHCYVISYWLTQRLGGHVGAHQGHYVWLSPDASHYIDLTGNHRTTWTYERNDGTYHRVPSLANDRTRRYAKRADRIFDRLDKLIRLGLDYAGDSHPAEEPQAADDSDRFADSWNDPQQYWHDEPDPTTPAGVYQFVYANGQLEVSPNHSHDELAGHAGVIPDQHTGPFAAGHVVVTNGRATWEVQANVNLHAFFKVLKDATKNYGWRWGGMTDSSGQPIIEEFAPKKSGMILHYVFAADHLYLGRTAAADLSLGIPDDCDDQPVAGTIKIVGQRAEVQPVHLPALSHLFEWADDSGLTLYANNDNVIKTIPDLQLHNTGDPDGSQNPVEPPPVDERLPSGLYQCPSCQRLFPNWHEYSKHRRDEESWGDPDRSGNGGLPQPDPGLYGDGAHFTEQRQEPGITTGSAETRIHILPARSWREAARVDGFARYAKAFSFDNDDYRFYVAYRHGDPLGYVAVKPDGEIQMMHAAVENQGIGKALYTTLIKHYDSLYTHAAHEKTASILKHFGWVQAKGQLWRWAAGQSPKDLIDAPIPFIYDVDKDKIYMGHAGARTSDIPGKFTPGGIVEGTYAPGGKVLIRSLTSIPYTVRHLIELWYYSQPQLEVKSVHLQDDAGKDTRLASDTTTNIGPLVQASAAADPAVQTVANTLQMAGGEVYAVGGAVRDAVMGKDPKDIDLMVTGLPPAKVSHLLESLPGRVDFTGKDFGVFRYRFKGRDVEIALPRRDRSTGAGHQDFDVRADHTMKPEGDLYRRDFTANAMGVNLKTGQLVDPFGGAEDIASGTLRTLSPQSLGEDPLRVVRALVAHARHGLSPDDATRAQMENHAHSLKNLPNERLQAELDKLMSADHPARAIRLARETGVLKHILPEVDEAFKFGSQNNPHHELDLGDHLLHVLDRISQKTSDPDLRMAALLHDIGKPGSAWQDPETGANHYYEHHLDDGTTLGADHEKLGADLAERRLGALKYPNERIARVRDLVAGHMYPHYTTERGARRFLQRYEPHADDLQTLRWADQGGKSAYPSDPSKSLDTERKLIQLVRNRGEATTTGQLAINGNDLIKAGQAPGPLMGATLRYLTDQVVDDPSLNTPDTLLQLANDYAIINAQQS